MKALRLLALAAAFCGGSLVANADGRPDVVYTSGPIPCASCESMYLGYDWGGVYAGGHLGMAFARSESTITELGLLQFQHTSSGIAGGVHLGWQKQWGNTIAGVEVSYTALDADITSHTSIQGVLVARSSDVSNLVTLTGRLGYAQDNLLAYVKAGYASADVELGLRVGDPIPAAGSASDREQGWTAGVGLEYAYRDNIILGVEYNYVRLSVDDRVLAPTTFVAREGSIDLQSILARVSFKFRP